MQIKGYLTGLTPKEKKTIKIITVKIELAFDPKILSSLSEYFGEEVELNIWSPQKKLDLPIA